MTIYERLPTVLWDVVGEFIFCDIVPSLDSQSIELVMKKCNYFYIKFDDDGEIVTVPGCPVS